MNAKRVKKLKEMAALFYQMQPPDMPNRKSLDKIYQEIKQIHKNKRYGNQKKGTSVKSDYQ